MTKAEELRELSTTQDLAQFTGLSVPTLVRWRLNGIGPRVTYLGRACRYRRADVLAWLDASSEKRSA